MKGRQTRQIRIILTILLIALPLGLYVKSVDAASLTSVRDTIEDSRPSEDANHEIQFVTSTGVTTSQTIILTFDDTGDAFNLSNIDHTDIDIAEDTDGTPGDCSGTLTDKTLAASASGTDWGVAVDTGTDIITLTAPSGGTPVTAGACIIIEIGDNATSQVVGDQLINNPASQGSYSIDIDGTMADDGRAMVAIIDTITASVTVEETLTFTVAGVTAANCTDRTGMDSEITTTATSVPFATPTVENFIDGCQSLTVSTNASSGYSVTAVESDQLTSAASDQILDGTCDGACSETAWGVWDTNTNNGFGYCVEDQSGTDANAASGEQCDDATPEFKIIPELNSESPESVMSNAGVVSSSQVHVGYRLSVSEIQASGTYTNNIIFVATPTY